MEFSLYRFYFLFAIGNSPMALNLDGGQFRVRTQVSIGVHTSKSAVRLSPNVQPPMAPSQVRAVPAFRPNPGSHFTVRKV